MGHKGCGVFVAYTKELAVAAGMIVDRLLETVKDAGVQILNE